MSVANKKLYVGFHIAKTAGSSLISSFEKRASYPSFIQLSDMNRYYQEGKLFPFEIPSKEKIDIIFGHQVNDRLFSFFSDRELYTFTFLRDPREMLGSHYAFHLRLNAIQGRVPLSPDEFNRLRGDNFICRSLVQAFPYFSGSEGGLLERARNVLKSFNLVVSLSDYEKKMAVLEKQIGIKLDLNEKPRNVTSTLEKQAIEGKLSFSECNNQSDVIIYEEYLAKSELNNPYGFDPSRRKSLVQELGGMNLIDEEIRFLTKAMKDEVLAYEGSDSGYIKFSENLNRRSQFMVSQN